MKNGNRRTGLRMTVPLYVCLLLFGVTPCLAETWHTEIIEDDLAFWGFQTRGFVSDSTGTLHMLMRGNRLIYARCPEGGDWQAEEIAPSPCGLEASMAVSQSGIPHVAYYDPKAKRLFHAVREDDGWRIEPAGDLYLAGRYNSICLDSIDNPVISFLAHGPLRLCVARLYDYGWDIETIWGVEVDEHSTSIGMDAQGLVHVALLQKSEPKKLILVSEQHQDWMCRAIAEGESLGYGPVLYANESGGPYVVYQLDHTYYCAVFQDPNLFVEELPEVDFFRESSDLSRSGCLTICGYLSRSFSGDNYLDLDLFVRTSSGWVRTHQETMIDDNSGTPEVTHHFDEHQRLHVVKSGGIWHDRFIEIDHYNDALGDMDRKVMIRGYYNQEPRTALNPGDDRPHVVWYRYGRNQLMHAVKTSIGWEQETVLDYPTGPWIGQYSVTMNRDNQPAICYEIGGQLRLTVKTEQGWTDEVIREGAMCGQVAYDHEEREHAIYYYYQDNLAVLGYSRRLDNGGWHHEEVYRDVRPVHVSSHQLEIDDLNRPNVVFRSEPYQGRYGKLRYGLRSDGEWVFSNRLDYLEAECPDVEILLGPDGSLNILHTFHSGCVGGADQYVNYLKLSAVDPSVVLMGHSALMIDGGSLQLTQSGHFSILGTTGALVHFYGFGECGTRTCSTTNPYFKPHFNHRIDSHDSIHVAGESDGIVYMRLSRVTHGVRLQSDNREWNFSGNLKAIVYHDSLETIPAALIVAMQYGNQFWFYPNWSTEFHGHPINLLPAPYGAEYQIVDREFSTDTEFHLTFWAALMTPDLSRIIGGDDGIDSIDITCSPW